MSERIALDSAFVISVAALRSVLSEISGQGKKWDIVGSDDDRVVLSYEPDTNPEFSGINLVAFSFPIITNLPTSNPEDGAFVCLSPVAVEHLRKGLYWNHGKLKNDDYADWGQFWTPIEAALHSHYLEVVRQVL